MNLKNLLLVGILVVFHLHGLAQIETKQTNRSLPNNSVYQQPQTSRSISKLSFKIEDGKIWINGNLIPAKDLPDGLKKIDPSLYYQTSVFGIDEISFTLQGETYVVLADRVVQLQRNIGSELPANTYNQAGRQQNEGYYSDLKRESPALFESLTYEGKLYERAQVLVWQYQKAKPKDRAPIREELRAVLGQIFDLNENNRQREIQELEQLLKAANEEVSYRKSRKRLIVDNALYDLLGE